MTHYLRLSFRILGWTIVGVLGILTLALLMLRTAPVQQWGVQRATHWLSAKIGSEVSIDKLRLGYGGSLKVEKLLFLSPEGDTLLYSGKLETRILWWNLPAALEVTHLHWEDVVGRVFQREDSTYNFNFLLDAFNSSEGTVESNTAVAEVSDTTAKSADMRLQIGPISFKRFDLKYGSEPLGIFAELAFADLELLADTVDLEKQRYHLSSFHLFESMARIRQESRLPAVPDSSNRDAILPHISLGNLELLAADWGYTDEASSYQAQLGRLFMQLPNLELDGQRIKLDSLVIQNSKISLLVPSTDAGSTVSSPKATKENTVAPFVWPDWQLKLGALLLENNHFAMQTIGHTAVEGFDAGQMAWYLNRALLSASYVPAQAGLKLSVQGLSEQSGINLQQLQGHINLGNRDLTWSDWQLHLGNSKLEANAKVSFVGIEELLELRESLGLQLQLHSPAFFAADVDAFAPALKKEADLQPFLPIPLAFDFAIRGSLRDLKLDTLQLDWGHATRFATSGTINRVLEPKLAAVRLPALEFKSVSHDLQLLYPDTALLWPAYVKLEGGVAASMTSLSSGLKLQLPGGNAFLMALYDAEVDHAFTLDADLTGEAWARLLRQPDIGDLGLNVHLSGNGNTLDSLRAELDGQLQTIEYLGQRYDLLNFGGTFNDKLLSFKADINQKDLAFDLDLQARLDSLQPMVDLHLRLLRANLQSLGIREEELIARLNLEAHYEAQGDDLEAQLKLTDGLLFTRRQRYPIDSIVASLKADSSGLSSK